MRTTSITLGTLAEKSRMPSLACSTRCFATYGTLAAREDLATAIERVAKAPADGDAIVAAALRAFSEQRSWLGHDRLGSVRDAVAR